MNRTQKRLLGSFLLSCACAMASHIWYKSTSSGSYDGGGRTPIAQLVESTNEVQRKPMKRLIWQTLSENDQLFSGEQIRTTQNSEARIQIVKTGTIISLEPDSLITLDEKDGQLSLDFLQGNLFVKGGKGDDSLKLKTGGKEIAIGGADVSFGKGQSGQLDVQVFSGSINGVKASEDPFQIVSPEPQSEVHVSPDGKDRVTFEFKKKFADGTRFILETGKTRTDLKAVADTTLGPQKVLARLGPGDYFWRLVAVDPNNQAQTTTSGIYRVRIFPKRPPVPLFPEKEQALGATVEAPNVSFRWANPGKLKELVLELATTSDFKQGRQEHRLTSQDFIELPFEKSGTYYWRVTGFLKSNEAVPSVVQKFSLKIGGDLSAPALELPKKGERVGFTQLKSKGVGFVWKTQTLAKSYTLRIKSKSASGGKAVDREESSAVNSLRITDLPPGAYEWTVQATSLDGKDSKASESWNFTIEEIPSLAWKDESTTSYFDGETPKLVTEWLPGPKGVERYRLSVRPEEDEATQPGVAEFVKTSGAVPVERVGRYIASVEGLNAQGVVVARSVDRKLEVKPAPLLPAPNFAETMADPVKSSRRGDVELEWQSVEGAKGYVLELQDATGKVVKEEAVKSTRHSLRQLRPGEFRLQVRGVDQAGRRGLASEGRSVLVPDGSDVKAPKMMKIKVQ